MNLTALRIDRIGVISKGIDGTDEYLLVTDNEGADTVETVQEQLREVYYEDTNRPGGYYCHTVTVAQHPDGSDGKFIAIVQHRYDV